MTAQQLDAAERAALERVEAALREPRRMVTYGSGFRDDLAVVLRMARRAIASREE